MIKVPQSYEIISGLEDPVAILKKLERIARVCHKSEGKISEDLSSAKDLLSKCLARGEESPIEHHLVTVRFVIDRGVSHELVRHRVASYTQESTRYVNYASEKNNNGENVYIDPTSVYSDDRYAQWINPDTYLKEVQDIWEEAMLASEEAYRKLIEKKVPPQIARSVLPNSTKTEIYVSANLREWRHIFKMRTAAGAHPQMKEVMIPLYEEMKMRLPIIFDVLDYSKKSDMVYVSGGSGKTYESVRGAGIKAADSNTNTGMGVSRVIQSQMDSAWVTSTCPGPTPVFDGHGNQIPSV